MAEVTRRLRVGGPVAQLVEHRVYTAGVVGSSPAGPTHVLSSPHRVPAPLAGRHPVCHLGWGMAGGRGGPPIRYAAAIWR